MLIVTDRQDGSRHLRENLSFLGPCQVVSVGSVAPDIKQDLLIVSDVATDTASQIAALQQTIERHRVGNAPYLFLLRSNTHFARTQAFALGASSILPHDATRQTLHETIIGLVEGFSATVTNQAIKLQIDVQKASSALANIMDSAKTGNHISLKVLSAGTSIVLEAVALSDVSSWLQVVGDYDDITYQHSLLVAGLAAAFSIKLGFNLQDRRRLTKAALLHDIGKAHIPTEILNKVLPLTAEEMAIMRTHALIGYDLLKKQGGFVPELLDVVRHHHEYLNGSGYPDGLKAEEIPDIVRLITMCDIYAALIERRSYKEALSPTVAYKILQDMDEKIDAALLQEFHKVISSPKIDRDTARNQKAQCSGV